MSISLARSLAKGHVDADKIKRREDPQGSRIHRLLGAGSMPIKQAHPREAPRRLH